MAKATTCHPHDRYAMLKGVYEGNRCLGEVGPRSRPATRRSARSPRHRMSWALLGIALVLGPAFGYLGQTGLRQTAAPGLDTALEPVQSQGLPASQLAHGHSDVPSIPVTLDLAIPGDPDAVPVVKHGTWSDFDRLLRDDKSSLSEVFGLAFKTIVIDPGHGGRDPGAIGAGGTMEKDITLDIALRLRERLRKVGNYRILMTRDSDRTVRLNKRVAFANKNKADLFISIHINAFPDVRMKTIETYYFGAPPDAAAIELAKLENTDSQYSLAAFNSMLEKIGYTVKHQESAALAGSIQRSLIDNIRKVNLHMRNTGVKTAPFVVLLGVDAPSVLTEVSCITNPDEEEKLNTPAYRETMASLIEKGVHEYLRRRQSPTAGDERDGRQRNG